MSKKQRMPDRPDRNDAHLQALRAGIRGSQLLVDALIEQPEAGQEPSTLETAAKAFETAKYWTEKSRGAPGKDAT
jgi:hypothetical protein